MKTLKRKNKIGKIFKKEPDVVIDDNVKINEPFFEVKH
jgi:hypothetical protein